MKRLRLILFVLCIAPQFVWAMACTVAGSTQIVERQSIGSQPILVPVTTPDRQIIWSGPTRTVQIHCYLDLFGHENSIDYIYYYVNPQNVNTSGWGIEFGMRINNNEVWESTGAVPAILNGAPAFVPPCPNAHEIGLGNCRSTTFVANFQPLIRKAGLTPFSAIPAPEYNLFQIDGFFSGSGLNFLHNNYNYILTDLNQIQATTCTINTTVTPEPGVVEFGALQMTSSGFTNPTVPTREFSLLLQKSGCNTPLKTEVVFSSPRMNDNLILPASGSAFGIRIVRADDGSTVQLNEPLPLATFAANETRKSVYFRAELIPFGDLVPGPFTATATFTLNYL